MNQLIIKGRLPGFNEYDKVNKNSKYGGGAMKKEYTQLVYTLCKEQKITKCNPIEIIFSWYEPNKKRDKDNIAFAKKFIFDGLVLAKVLDGDGWKGYGDFSDRFYIDKKNPRVVVELI